MSDIEKLIGCCEETFPVTCEKARKELNEMDELAMTNGLLINNYKESVEMLVKERGALKEALQWCGGSADFGDGGKARKGWLKICYPLITNKEEGKDDKTYPHPGN